MTFNFFQPCQERAEINGIFQANIEGDNEDWSRGCMKLLSNHHLTRINNRINNRTTQSD